MTAKRLLYALFALSLLTAIPGFAEGTRTWTQNSFEEFEKGTAKGVAIRSDGSLELAPAFKAIYTTPSTYIWSIAADAEGNVYAAAGSPARVYRVSPGGQATVIFEPRELQVQALVVDPSGALYAATSPDGKVYKIERRRPEKETPSRSEAPGQPGAATADTAKITVDPSFTSAVLFDPKTKYIWDLALDAEGRLYVATGDHGEIFRVLKSGESALFFKSDEAHIRVLTFDGKGNLIAGSDSSGLVYRISPAGEAFVLYSAAKKEITALATDAAGNIYAAGVGEKRGAGVLSFPQPQPGVPQPAPTVQQPGVTMTITPVAPVTPVPGFLLPLTAAGGSEVYRIAPDGSPRRIWSSREDLVYALAFDERGRLLAGTGNKGRIVAIESEGEFTDLLKASASQVTAFAQAPNHGLYVSTSNLGKLFLLGPAPDAQGSYESEVFDARIFSRWGRVAVLGGGGFDLYARSGNVDNPDRNWSPWHKVDLARGAETGIPAARFAQWKAELRPGEPAARIDRVVLNYRPNNVAPVIDDVIVQVGVRYQSIPKLPTEAPPISSSGGNPPPQPRYDVLPPTVRDRDSIGVRWVAHDDNDDELVYSLYYRGDGETRWKLLKDKITDKSYSFDAGLLPDGGYTVKVMAADAPSHSPDEALTDQKESPRFEVDNTPPRIEELRATLEGGRIHVSFRAVDNFSPIKRAEYSVDAAEWHLVEPVGQLSDALAENYDFRASLPAATAEAAPPTARSAKPKDNPGEAGEHVIVVRVYDRFENMAAAKTVLRK